MGFTMSAIMGYSSEWAREATSQLATSRQSIERTTDSRILQTVEEEFSQTPYGEDKDSRYERFFLEFVSISISCGKRRKAAATETRARNVMTAAPRGKLNEAMKGMKSEKSCCHRDKGQERHDSGAQGQAERGDEGDEVCKGWSTNPCCLLFNKFTAV